MKFYLLTLFKLVFIISNSLSISNKAFGFDFNQDPKSFKKKIGLRPEASISQQTFKLLTRAQEDFSQGEKKRAFKLFNKLLKRTQTNKSEYAQILQNMGFAYAQDEKNNEALKTFLKALDQDALSQTPTLMVIYIIGQIYALKGEHKKSIEVLSFWLKVAPNPSGTAYAMLAASLYELGQKNQALLNIQKAINLTDRPKESWLSMAVSLYFAKDQYLEAAKVLKLLVAENPKKAVYWRQWAGSQLNANKEKEALVSMELGEIYGLLKSKKDIKNSADLMVSTEIPYKAALWIEQKLSKKDQKPLKVQKLLASAYVLARENEKALGVLRRIHKDHKEIKTSIQLGQILLDEEKWKESIEVFKKAKGLSPTKDQKEQILVGLGVAHFNLGDINRSREALIQVVDSSKVAQEWLNFIQKQSQ